MRIGPFFVPGFDQSRFGADAAGGFILIAVSVLFPSLLQQPPGAKSEIVHHYGPPGVSSPPVNCLKMIGKTPIQLSRVKRNVGK